MNLQPDLQGGIVPISEAAKHLAALLRQAKQTQRPIAMTQKGRPTAVLLTIDQFTALRELAEAQDHEQEKASCAT